MQTISIYSQCLSPLSNSLIIISLQATYTKVPPDRLKKTTSMMEEVSVIDIPIMIPIGVIIAKMPKKSKICLVV